MSDPVTALCIYQVRPGAEADFESQFQRHWTTLHELELVTDRKPEKFRGRNEDGTVFYVEILEWRDQTSIDSAHELPEVAAIWERMGPLCEARGGKPAMEFPEVERI